MVLGRNTVKVAAALPRPTSCQSLTDTSLGCEAPAPAASRSLGGGLDPAFPGSRRITGLPAPPYQPPGFLKHRADCHSPIQTSQWVPVTTMRSSLPHPGMLGSPSGALPTSSPWVPQVEDLTALSHSCLCCVL